MFNFKWGKKESGRIVVEELQINLPPIDVEDSFNRAVKREQIRDLELQVERLLLTKIHGEALVQQTIAAARSGSTSKELYPKAYFYMGGRRCLHQLC
jgi:hypothetical protein